MMLVDKTLCSEIKYEQFCENQREPDMFVVPMKTICSTIQLFPREPATD